MELLKLVGLAVALLVMFAVGMHMVTLFLIGGTAIVWHLVAAFAAHPVSGTLLVVAAAAAGNIFGRGIDATTHRAHLATG
jgi:hypothetical protein